MARPARLSRDEIVGAAVTLVEQGGPDALTMKALGAALGADPSAVYRHVQDKDELLRAVGDHLLNGVVEGLPGRRTWDDTVRTVCLRLRAALLARPQLADLTRSAPTRQRHELRLTEVLLSALVAGGFPPDRAAAAYHALIELTVGSATIDGTTAAMDPAVRRATYAAWRRDYQALPADEFPHCRAVAGHLYRGDADRRFRFALAALLHGLVATVPG
jgi:AcrR family transcriptional regulator